MSDNIFEQLKNSTKASAQKFALGDQETINSFKIENQDEIKLKLLFSEVMDTRKQVFSNFDKILDLRLNVFEYHLSVMVAARYISEIASTTRLELMPLIEMYIISESSLLEKNITEYFDTMTTFIKKIGPDLIFNVDEDSIIIKVMENFKSYFSDVYDRVFEKSLKDVAAYPLYAIDPFTTFDEVEKILLNQSNNEIDPYKNYSYLLLYTLGLLANSNLGDYSRVVEVAKSNLYLARAEITKKLNIDLEKIEKNIDSFIAVEDIREKEDSFYFKDFSNNLKLRFQELSESLDGLLSKRTYSEEELIQNARLLSVSSSVSNLENYVLDELRNNIRVIKKINSYLDNYIPIVRLSKRYSEIYKNSIDILFKIPGMNLDQNTLTGNNFPQTEQERQELQDRINQNNFDRLYFIFTDVLDDFTAWESDFYRLVKLTSDSIFNVILLYTGVQLSKLRFSPSTNIYFLSSREYVNYSIENIIKKDLVSFEELSNEYIAVRDISQKLLKDHNLRVIEDIDEEKIPSSLKTVMPQLDIVDLFSVEECISYTNIEQETDLKKAINFQFLKAVLSNKENINKILTDSIKVFELNKYNFKSLYFSLAIRSSFNSIIRYTEDLETNMTDETRSFVADYMKNVSAINEIKDTIENYKRVWKFFYDNSINTPLFQIALKTTSLLRVFLNAQWGYF